MQHDVKEAREAIAEVADNNAILAAVCLTEGATALDWSTTSHKPLHMSVSAAVHAVVACRACCGCMLCMLWYMLCMLCSVWLCML